MQTRGKAGYRYLVLGLLAAIVVFCRTSPASAYNLCNGQGAQCTTVTSYPDPPPRTVWCIQRKGTTNCYPNPPPPSLNCDPQTRICGQGSQSHEKPKGLKSAAQVKDGAKKDSDGSTKSTVKPLNVPAQATQKTLNSPAAVKQPCPTPGHC